MNYSIIIGSLAQNFSAVWLDIFRQFGHILFGSLAFVLDFITSYTAIDIL